VKRPALGWWMVACVMEMVLATATIFGLPNAWTGFGQTFVMGLMTVLILRDRAASRQEREVPPQRLPVYWPED